MQDVYAAHRVKFKRIFIQGWPCILLKILNGADIGCFISECPVIRKIWSHFSPELGFGFDVIERGIACEGDAFLLTGLLKLGQQFIEIGAVCSVKRNEDTAFFLCFMLGIFCL